MSSFSDYRYALEFRGIIEDIVKSELERQRPRYQLGEVTSIDRLLRKCQVRYNGEVDSVTINMGSVQPSAVGQVVRVDGMPGDRYVAEVLGSAYEPLEARLDVLESSPDVTSNFCANGSFEEGLNGFSVFWSGGTTPELDTLSVNAYSGNNSVKIAFDDPGDYGTVQTSPYMVQPGEGIMVSYVIKWEGTGAVPNSKMETQAAPTVDGANYFGVDAEFNTPIVDGAVTSTYTRRTGVWYPPPGINFARFSVRVGATGTCSGTVHLDSIRLQRIALLPADVPVTFDSDVWANDGIILPGSYNIFSGLRGRGAAQLDLLRRFGGIGLKGGGLRKVTSSAIGWTTRFVIAGQGRSANHLTEGLLDISMPADTTVINRYGNGGASTVTVAGGMIPFAQWDALYFNVDLPQAAAFNSGNFRIVNATSDYEVPPDWILIASRNDDTGRVTWGDGREQDYWRSPSLLNSWVTYGGTYGTPGYKKENGIVYLDGLVKNGTVSTTSTGDIFALPAGCWPRQQAIFSVQSNNAAGRADVLTDGSVRAMAGSSTWFSFSGISFAAAG